MSQTIESAAIAARLADYLNGHLSPSERADVERALEGDPELREQLQFETQVQAALRADSAAAEAARTTVNNSSGFAAIADRLDARRTRWLPDIDWLRPVAVPAFALMVGLLVFWGPTEEHADVQVNTFETLSDKTAPAQVAHLQILLAEPLSTAVAIELLAAHSLEYRANQSADLLLIATPVSQTAKLATIASALESDARVKFVKVIESP
ncbi:MAG: hypothetical protein AAF515_13475 [Pseudomonadota bacterium]